jgi:MFS family permease
MNQEEAGLAYIPLVGLVALGTVVAVVPAARVSDRVGRKKVIYVSCVVGAIGLGLVALAPSFPLALIGTGIFGLSTGIFLAVDWALMTDIIPKASSGRYMGLSNVATASSGVLAVAIGGLLMDVIGGPDGPRAALWMAVVLFGVGAVLLRPVDERRRDDFPRANELDEPAVLPPLTETVPADAI